MFPERSPGSHLPETSAIPFGVAVGRDVISPDTIEKTSPSLRIQVTTPQVILSNLEANPISIHVHVIFTYMGVSKNRGGPPKWMVKIMENPIKMGWFGGKPTIFGNIHIWLIFMDPMGVEADPINASMPSSRHRGLHNELLLTSPHTYNVDGSS